MHVTEEAVLPLLFVPSLEKVVPNTTHQHRCLLRAWIKEQAKGEGPTWAGAVLSREHPQA